MLTFAAVCVCFFFSFAEADDHQNKEDTCQKQPTCSSAGTHYFGSDTARVRTCTQCPDKSYQLYSNHTVTDCKVQPFCRKGTFLSTDDKFQKGVCTACPAGQFQDLANFQGTSCTSCGVTQCQAGEETLGALSSLILRAFPVLIFALPLISVGHCTWLHTHGQMASLHYFTVLSCLRVRVHANCPYAGSRITGTCPVVGSNTIKCEKCDEHTYSRIPHNVVNLKDGNGDHSITQYAPLFFPLCMCAP